MKRLSPDRRPRWKSSNFVLRKHLLRMTRWARRWQMAAESRTDSQPLNLNFFCWLPFFSCFYLKCSPLNCMHSERPKSKDVRLQNLLKKPLQKSFNPGRWEPSLPLFHFFYWFWQQKTLHARRFTLLVRFLHFSF